MTYVLRLADDASRTLVVDALRSASSQRTRVASRAALEVAADKAQGRDVRSASVKVTALLAEAAQLGALADELATAEAVPVVARPVVDVVDGKAITVAPDTGALEATPLTAEGQPDDDDEPNDGLSDAARAAMAQAEQFTAEHLDDPDEADVDTGADPEDEPDTDQIEEALK